MMPTRATDESGPKLKQAFPLRYANNAALPSTQQSVHFPTPVVRSHPIDIPAAPVQPAPTIPRSATLPTPRPSPTWSPAFLTNTGINIHQHLSAHLPNPHLCAPGQLLHRSKLNQPIVDITTSMDSPQGSRTPPTLDDILSPSATTANTAMKPDSEPEKAGAGPSGDSVNLDDHADLDHDHDHHGHDDGHDDEAMAVDGTSTMSGCGSQKEDASEKPQSGEVKKKCRITRACATCRQRRKKCDGQYPCGPCIENGRTCIFTPAKRRGPPPKNSVAPPDIVPTMSSSMSSSVPHAAFSLAHHSSHMHGAAAAPSSAAAALASVGHTAAVPSLATGNTSLTSSASKRRKRSLTPSSEQRACSGSDVPASPTATSADAEQGPLSDSTGTASAANKPQRSTSAAQGNHQQSMTVASSLNVDHPPPSMCRADLLKEVNELAEKMTVVVSVDKHGGHAHISNHGHAGALHLFRNWTRTFTPNARDGLVYIPDLVCCPPRPAVMAMHKILFPAPALVDMLVDYYFDHIHPFLPFVSRAKIQSQRVSETPSYALMYSLLAASAQQFERRYRVGPMHGVLVSHLLLTRAKALVQPMLSSPTPCLLNIQALLLIEMADRESVRGAPWLISGMAIRMALDIGLNLGIPESVKEMNLVSVPVWSKTWIYCCIVDSLNSFQTGRSHMISDSDSVHDLDECILNDHNADKYGASELIPCDHFFVWLFKLFEITGKIGRTITSIRIRRNLPYSLPELHSLLSKFRSNLPKSLVYDFERPNRNSVFAVHLNLLYLGTVIFLYRTIFACNLLVHSPLRVEYMRILESSTDAILTIFGAHLDTVHLAPLPLGYAFDLIYTVCVILMSQGQPPLPTAPVHVNGTSTPPGNNSNPASPSVDARNKPKAVRILSQCLQLLDSLAMAQPLLRRHAALGKELLESITGTVQDCDRDRRLLTEHLEVIKASEAVVAEWSADPLVERREADTAFTSFLSVPRSTLSYFGSGASGGSKASALAWQRAASVAAAAASTSASKPTTPAPESSASSVTATGVHQLAAAHVHAPASASQSGYPTYLTPVSSSSLPNAAASSSSAAAAAILAGMTASEMISAMRTQQHQQQGAAAAASASATLMSLYNPTTGQQQQFVAPPGTVFSPPPSLGSSSATLMYAGQQQPVSTSPPTHGIASPAYFLGQMHAQQHHPQLPQSLPSVLELPTFPAELLTNDVAMLDVSTEGSMTAAPGTTTQRPYPTGGDTAANPNHLSHLSHVGNALGQVVNVAGFLHPGNGFNFAFHE